MFAKIRITGDVELLTAMHIGGNAEYMGIGSVDSPVIKDGRTGLPFIPGSSFKGRMRTLLAEKYPGSSEKPEDDSPRVARLFGVSKLLIEEYLSKSARKKIKKKKVHIEPTIIKTRQLTESRLQIYDLFLAGGLDPGGKSFHSGGASPGSATEITAQIFTVTDGIPDAPKLVEAAVPGSVFRMEMIYEACEEDTFLEDMETLAQGLRLLRENRLGGCKARGFGEIRFSHICAEPIIGSVPDDLMTKCRRILGQGAEEESRI